MKTLLLWLLAAIVAAELIIIIGFAAVFFLFGTVASIAFGAGMLVAAAGAGLVTLRAVRSN